MRAGPGGSVAEQESVEPRGGDAEPVDASPWRSRWQERLRPRGRLDPVVGLVALLSLLCSAAFVAVSLAYNDGRLIAPLDDVYIHLQYAREIGAGNWFAYNPGDPVSTGASSLLYVVVMGGVAALGVQGSTLLAAAVLFGAVCVAVTCGLVVVLGTRVAGRRVGIWAGLLTALNGTLLWGATSGMEVGLMALLLIATVLGFVVEAPRVRFVVTPALGVLLALTRPEGLIVAAAVCAGMLWTLVRHARAPRWLPPEWDGWARWSGRAVITLLPLLAGAAQFAFYRSATGSAQANGVQSKSWLHQGAGLPLPEVLDHTMRNVQDLAATLSGLAGAQDVLPPAAGIVALLGLAALMVGPARGWRTLGVVLAVGIGLVILSVSTLVTAMWQNLRYVQPFLPLILLLAVVGVDALLPARPASTSDGPDSHEIRRRRLAFHGLLAVALIATVVYTPTWALRLAQQASTIREAPVSIGNWLRGHVPAGSTVAVNDVGAVAYFSGLRTFDLVGLATDGMATAANNGPGTLYERLGHLPAAARPTIFSIYDDWPGVDVQDLKRSGVLGTDPLTTFYLKSPARPVLGLAPPPCQTDRSCKQVSVWRADWSLVGSGDRPDRPLGGTLRDAVNVGDLDDEAAHGWHADLPLPGLQPTSDVTRRELPGARTVVDSSRHIVGGETFTLHHLTPGRPVTLTARVTPRADGEDPPADAGPGTGAKPSTTSAATGTSSSSGTTTLAGQEVAVTAGGAPVGRWTLNPGEGSNADAWTQTRFDIPASDVTGPDLTVSTGPLQPFLAPYPDYRSYHYWATQ
ncbi:hypothetical protein LQ327_15670 [Actinomycetospora endophytica]|uniref:4-amino-4-deoxy-L-arabinose transferase-like glycosyltransferase n=1 Tax=Actinomycetospora endophytica TaxID=2291215 RepID=A0ABS8PBC1_9PSEU|nr:hypothetical protein [Actinomycetospora endophytica]MCD2194810.1 hypothetical protein [Actinomycetospora endophytica]